MLLAQRLQVGGLDPKARDFIIRKAATHGQATFASEAFGRGTDFFCKDSKLTNAGAPPAGWIETSPTGA